MIDSPTEIVTYYHSKEFMVRNKIMRDGVSLHCLCGLVFRIINWNVDCGIYDIDYREPSGNC